MLESINPSVKAFTIFIPGLLLAFIFDPVTPAIYLLFTITMTFLLSNIPFKKWLMIFTPFVLLSLGFAWMTALYTGDSFSGGEVILAFWWFEVDYQNLMVAISLGLRSLCLVALSLMFVLTTDSTKFMLSLMQQCKLPPKFTYGILAGYRFLPTFKHELEILRQAHRIRGVGRARGIKEKVYQIRRYAIPLLANAIRKAERVAIAMESKGFTGSTDRTHYYKLTVKKRDWVFLSGFVIVLFGAVYVSYQLGHLNVFGRKF
ncbi:energy-coupling factor transporter transmembrane protein EcfT [Bacillus shivajii]|uniref:energy-coupling factor transporter transmembrane component T family protein n=1 Tax=Bacillus shivajii TaxID=1983719 RepID=UPI001CFA99B7|nr:energy-coupling factor transporter transmembrane component T [Bacillus shivajii]UCZ52221.1 energy-coupling factor transporter transmembrane protein EcfT [Bacillus shivajii]